MFGLCGATVINLPVICCNRWQNALSHDLYDIVSAGNHSNSSEKRDRSSLLDRLLWNDRSLGSNSFSLQHDVQSENRTHVIVELAMTKLCVPKRMQLRVNKPRSQDSLCHDPFGSDHDKGKLHSNEKTTLRVMVHWMNPSLKKEITRFRFLAVRWYLEVLSPSYWAKEEKWKLFCLQLPLSLHFSLARERAWSAGWIYFFVPSLPCALRYGRFFRANSFVFLSKNESQRKF